MSDLRITLVQPNVHWENTQANLSHLEEKLSEQETGDIIVLPEMFSTGFSMNASALAEPMNFTTHKWMKMQASKHDALMVGSFIVKENNKYYNRCLWVFPNGEFGVYDKAHPFRMMDEHHHYAAGSKKIIFSWKGWNILPLICYDLRFPEWSRNSYIKSNDHFYYDLLIYMGNWPSARIKAWDVLLQARAMENSSYVAAVNRVGKDGAGVDFNGHSVAIGPRGEYLLHLEEEELIKTVELNLDELRAYREKFPAHLDW